MQTRVLHLIRDTFRLASRQHWVEVERNGDRDRNGVPGPQLGIGAAGLVSGGVRDGAGGHGER